VVVSTVDERLLWHMLNMNVVRHPSFSVHIVLTDLHKTVVSGPI